MLFVFDTTEFQDQRRIESSVFRLFAVARSVAKHQVFVPQIVIDEHARHVRESLIDVISTLRSNAQELTQFTGKTFELNLPDPDQELKRWQTWFVERLRRLGFGTLPYPSVPHSEVLAREFARRRPFDGKGKGYRDALIWESVTELARSRPEEIVLVSKNAGDFGKDGALHPDLVVDVVAASWLPTRIRLAHGIRAAVDAYLQQSLPATDPVLASAVATGAHPRIDLAGWLKSNLKTANPTLTIGTEEVVGLPREAKLDAVKSVDRLAVKEARPLAQGETFIVFEAMLTAGLRWFGHALPDTRAFAYESRDASASSSPGMYALAQFILSLTTLIVIDESVLVEGALTFGANGDVIGSDIWEARVVKPRKSAGQPVISSG